MKFYFTGNFKERENEEMAYIYIRPDSHPFSLYQPEVVVFVNEEIHYPMNGENFKVAFLEKESKLMIFPPSKDENDTRILVMDRILTPGINQCGFIDHERSTANILQEQKGGGGAILEL